MAKIRFEAACEFASISQSLFPSLLANASDPITADENVKDFLSSLYEEEEIDEATVGKLIRQFVPGICSLSQCLKWGTRQNQEIGQRLSKRLQNSMSMPKIEQYLRKYSSSIILSIFERFGSPFVANDVSVLELRDGVLDFANQFGNPYGKDVFHEVGLSCLELLVFASGWNFLTSLTNDALKSIGPLA